MRDRALSKRYDVIIAYEHKNRELESDILLADELIDRGYRVRIAQIGGNNVLLRRARTKVLVVPWCYDDKDVLFWQLHRGGFSDDSFCLVNMHCEQVSKRSEAEYLAPSGKATDIYHFAWGDYFKDQLIGHGVSPESICVTGSPRLDFFRRRELNWNTVERGTLATEHGLDPGKKWVMIVGNFTFAFLTEDAIKLYEDRGFSTVREFCDTCKASYDSILSWLGIVLEQDRSNDCEFIYRPHPSEPITDELLELADRFENLKIISEHPIRDWLFEASGAFMWNSTSCVEAAAAGVPVFALRPIDIPPDLRNDLIENVVQIDDVEKFASSIDLVIRGDVGDVNDQLLSSIGYYYQETREGAACIAADYIESIIHYPRKVLSPRKDFFANTKDLLKYLRNVALKWFGLSDKVAQSRLYANDHVSPREIEDMLESAKARRQGR